MLSVNIFSVKKLHYKINNVCVVIAYSNCNIMLKVCV